MNCKYNIQDIKFLPPNLKQKTTTISRKVKQQDVPHVTEEMHLKILFTDQF